MKVYWSVLSKIIQASFATIALYRTNFWSGLVLGLFWMFWAVAGTRVYFLHTDSINGWSYGETLLVLGVFFTLNGFRHSLITPNVSRLSEYVRTGQLDFLLLKPLNSQFLVSCNYINIHDLVNIVYGVAIVLFGMSEIGIGLFSVSTFIKFLISLVCGFMILYSFSLILHSLAIFYVNVQEADLFIQNLLEAGRFPVDIYNSALRFILTFLLPVGVMLTFPPKALLGQLDTLTIFLVGLSTAVIMVVGSLVWQSVIRFYTGTGS